MHLHADRPVAALVLIVAALLALIVFCTFLAHSQTHPNGIQRPWAKFDSLNHGAGLPIGPIRDSIAAHLERINSIVIEAGGLTPEDSVLMRGYSNYLYALVGHNHSGTYLAVGDSAGMMRRADSAWALAFVKSQIAAKLGWTDSTAMLEYVKYLISLKADAGTYLVPEDSTHIRNRSNALYALLAHDHSGMYQPSGTYLIPDDSTSMRNRSNALYAALAHNHDGAYQASGTYLVPGDTTHVRNRSDVLYFAKPLGTESDNYIPKWSAAAGAFVLRPDSVGAGGSGISAETAASMIGDSLGARHFLMPDDSVRMRNQSNALYSVLAHDHSGIYQPAGTYLVPSDTNLTLHRGDTTWLARKAWADGQYAAIAHNHDGIYQPTGTYLIPGDSTHIRNRSNALYALLGHDHSGVYQPAGTYLVPSDSNGTVRRSDSTWLARKDWADGRFSLNNHDHAGVYQASGTYLVPNDTNHVRNQSNALYSVLGHSHAYLAPDDTAGMMKRTDSTWFMSKEYANDYSVLGHTHGYLSPADTNGMMKRSDTSWVMTKVYVDDFSLLGHTHAGVYVPVADTIGMLKRSDTTWVLTKEYANDYPTKAAFPTTIGIACSDESTALTASTSAAKVTFRMPYAMTLTSLRAGVTTCPTGDTVLVDIHETGTSIMTNTKLHVDATEYTSTTAGVAYVLTDTALADDAEITIFVDRIGSTIAGAGLKVWLIGTRALP